MVAIMMSHTTSASDWTLGKSKNSDNVANVTPKNALCANGKNQSPVDIDTKKTSANKSIGIKFNYDLTLPETISNTGSLIQVNTGGWAKINVEGVEFVLNRLDFHIPSEHTIDGKHYPMEIQFIHKNKDNQLAVVSRMAVPGRPDRTLRKLLENLPMQAGQTEKLPANALKNIEMKKKYGNYYRYNGSTTAPPCEEGVRWYILKTPMSFSKEQYVKLKSALKEDNNRPIQDLNARLILE
jgi:carbonic anhydrase